MSANMSERKKIYLERKEKGLCPRCGNKRKKSSKFIICDDCREFYRNYSNSRSEEINETRRSVYETRKDNHQCPRCGKKLGKRYQNLICPVCLEKQYAYNKR